MGTVYSLRATVTTKSNLVADQIAYPSEAGIGTICDRGRACAPHPVSENECKPAGAFQHLPVT
jgi:hypothetical protein